MQHNEKMTMIMSVNDETLPNHINPSDLGPKVAEGDTVRYPSVSGESTTGIVLAVGPETILFENGDWCYVWQARKA